jgi:hypothetical protein
VFVSADSEMREMRASSAIVRLRGEHFPFPQCGDVAEIRRNDRRLVYPARRFRHARITVFRLRSSLARCDLDGVRHRQAVANVRRVDTSGFHSVLGLKLYLSLRSGLLGAAELIGCAWLMSKSGWVDIYGATP